MDKPQSQEQQTLAESVCEEFKRMSAERGPLESHLEEVSRLVVPAYAGSFTSPGMQTPGEKRTEHQYDSTAAIAANRFSAIMESLLTPRNSRWHRLVPSDKTLKRNRQVRLWFDEATDVLFKYRQRAKANFQNQMREVYFGLGVWGTGDLFVDELDAPGGGLRYRSIHLGELYFSENHQGIIDRAIRRFQFTARQAWRKWGDALPEKIQNAAKEKPETMFWFLHCVRPREDRDVNRLDARGKAYASYYVSEEGTRLLSDKGYNTFPHAISRYVKIPGEVYGRSPAMEVLPAIKVLNEEKKTVLKQGHRIVDPVLLAYDDGVVDTFSLKPGAVNYGGVSADGRPLVHTLPTGNLAVAKEMMDMERAAINDAFLITLFQILTENPQMTATEVLERTREKGMLVSPTAGRQETELLGPIIEREIDVLSQQGLLPPMPAILQQAAGEYDVEYDSPLSRAQKAEEAAGLSRTLELTLNVVNITQNPEPLDHFDWDVIIPEMADTQAVPARWMRDPAAVESMRESRAQQAQMQTAIEAAPAAAGLVKAIQPGAANAR